MLLSYLQEHEQDKAEGNTIANVLLEMHALRVLTNEHGIKLQAHEMRLDRHGHAIRALRNRMDTLADAGATEVRGIEHDTGVHQVEELKKHLAAKEAELKEHQRDRRDSVTWWRRKRTEVAIAILGATASMGVTAIAAIVWYLLTHGK